MKPVHKDHNIRLKEPETAMQLDYNHLFVSYTHYSQGSFNERVLRRTNIISLSLRL